MIEPFSFSLSCRVPLVDEFWVLLGYCVFTGFVTLLPLFPSLFP